ERLEAIAAQHGLRIKGRGMMLGVDAGSGTHAEAICKACFAKGLIIETSGSFDEVVKVLAPLTISHQQFAAGLDIMEAAFAAVMGSHRAAAESQEKCNDRPVPDRGAPIRSARQCRWLGQHAIAAGR